MGSPQNSLFVGYKGESQIVLIEQIIKNIMFILLFNEYSLRFFDYGYAFTQNDKSILKLHSNTQKGYFVVTPFFQQKFLWLLRTIFCFMATKKHPIYAKWDVDLFKKGFCGIIYLNFLHWIMVCLKIRLQSYQIQMQLKLQWTTNYL